MSDLSLKGARTHLAPVSETLSRLTKSLPASTTLIGFAGAPWTVATYMVAGRGTPDQAPARELARTEPEKFQEIIDMLVDVTVDYLAAQISAGADVVQLFESWAASLQGDAFERWCVKPVQAIIAGLRAKGLKTPVIGFPRGAHSPLAAYAEQTQCDVLALDTNVDRCLVSAACGQNVVLQGNLDPQILVAGGAELDAAVDAILEDFANRRFIFNLGHGILPETPPEHVTQLVARVKGKLDGFCVANLDWIEAFHIISVMFWMAGMYYLPRLFVYHAEAMEGGQEYGVFEKMEANLLRIIMNPAMIAAWTFGLLLSRGRICVGAGVWLWTNWHSYFLIGLSRVFGPERKNSSPAYTAQFAFLPHDQRDTARIDGIYCHLVSFSLLASL